MAMDRWHRSRRLVLQIPQSQLCSNNRFIGHRRTLAECKGALADKGSHAGNAGTEAHQNTTASTKSSEKPGVTRTYFIAADEVDWDYTPDGRNLAGIPHPESAENESALRNQS